MKLKPELMRKVVFKNFLVVILILFVSSFFAKMMVNQSGVAQVFSVILIFVLLFNIVVRNMFSFKPYFLSKWNIFSSKFSEEFEFDIPKDLAFEKILEVVAESSFILKYSSKSNHEIFVTTKFSWRSWGENIYIHIREKDRRTIVRFDSAALFQMYTWGKNENNFDEFLQRLDDSLTV